VAVLLTVWTCCCLQVYYLPAAAFKQQLTAITETAVVGSRLFFDFIHLDAMSAASYQPGFETLWLVSPKTAAAVWMVHNSHSITAVFLLELRPEVADNTTHMTLY